MAKIFGFEMKNVKTVEGREGYGCLGEMYINGKHIGSLRDYGDGSICNIDYDTAEDKVALETLAVEFAKTQKGTPTMDTFYKDHPDIFDRVKTELLEKFSKIITADDIDEKVIELYPPETFVGYYLDLCDIEKLYIDSNKYWKPCYIGKSADGKWYRIGLNNTNLDNYIELYKSMEDFIIER